MKRQTADLRKETLELALTETWLASLDEDDLAGIAPASLAAPPWPSS